MPHSTPNYLTTNPDGTVGAEFPGGVRILQNPNTIVTAARAVRWLNTAAQLVGYVNAFRAGLANSVLVAALSNDNTQTAILELDAFGGSAFVSARANTQQLTLLASDGTSELLRTGAGALANYHIVGCYCDSAGNIINQTGGILGVNRFAVGRYRISYADTANYIASGLVNITPVSGGGATSGHVIGIGFAPGTMFHDIEMLNTAGSGVDNAFQITTLRW
jgi:hypothetical protein